MRREVRGAMAAGIAAAAAILLDTAPALAVHPIIWTETPSGLLRGDPDSVVVSSTGALSLGPKVEPLSPRPEPSAPGGENAITDPILWSSALDGHGNLYLGTGNTGQVLRLDAKGELKVIASMPEPLVTALFVNRRGEILAGTSPGGAIYRIRTGEAPKVLFEPEERYIWSFTEDADGNLYAGTGERGKIFRITPEGEGSLFYDSPEPHITALECDRGRSLVAGTDGTGMVYRIDAQRSATVLYDSGYSEIVDIAIDGAGAIYAAAIASGVGEVPAPAPRLVVRAPEGEPLVPSSEDMGPVQPDSAPKGRDREELRAEIEGVLPGVQARRAKEGGGALFRITPAGKVEDLWRSSEEIPFSVTVASDGSVFAGTGEPARLLKIEERGRAVAIARFPQDQLTALLLDSSDRLFVVTNNAGAAYRMDRGLADSGIFVSQVRDVGPGARWGRIRWDASATAGARVDVQTRSGNSAIPDETWSPWSPSYSDVEGSEIISPPGRFLQWRVRLSRPGRGSPSPVVRSITATYLPANHAPKLRELKLLSWNESRSEPSGDATSASPSSPSANVTVHADSPADPDQAERGAPGGAANVPDAPSTGTKARNRIFVWHAEDPDGDPMVYRVLLQREGEESWSPVCADLAEASCSFDDRAHPEGRYKARVIGSDAPANYPGEELEAEAITDGAIIDHSPPVLEKVPGRGTGTKIQVRATDAYSPVDVAEILSGDRVIAVARPLDGVLDSRTETLEIDLPDPLPVGLRLRVRDTSGNEAVLGLDSQPLR